MNSIKAGDVVVLNSGGPQMTVSWIEEGNAYCVWFNKSEQKGAEFPIATLKKQ